MALLRAAVEATGASGAFGVTDVRLDRDEPSMLDDATRLDVLATLAATEGWGVFTAPFGLYLDVARALGASGYEPTFIIGSDKLAQLADPRFYQEGQAGVDATFELVGFLVVPRPGFPLPDASPSAVLEVPGIGHVSATEVRRRHREGRSVADLVPPVVVEALRGYTAADG